MRDPKPLEIEPRKKIITVRPNGTKRVQFGDYGPSKTDESFSQEADVNYIMDKFTKSGQITHLQQQPGRFADITEVSDLMGAFEIVKTAEKMFNALPSAVRAKFHNNPLLLEEWLANPKNAEEAIDLGLMTRKETKQPSASSVPDKKGKKSSAGKPPAEEPDEE